MKKTVDNLFQAVFVSYTEEMEEEYKKELEAIRGRRVANVGMREREFQAWNTREHYLNYPLIAPEKIPMGYLQYWSEEDLCYRVAPASEADRHDTIKLYPKSNHFMEDETVVAPEVAEEVVDAPVEEPVQEEVVDAPVEEEAA